MIPKNSANFETIISKPRLDSYKGYFKTKKTEESIGLYVWNSELASNFNNLISLFEIALRNNIHRTMSLYYSYPQFSTSSIHWYDKIRGRLKSESIKKIEDIRFRKGKLRVAIVPAPTPDEIVSRLTFGVWPNILSSIDARYADQLLSNIFPNHPLSSSPLQWKDPILRGKALNYIYEINAFRNRIAHHEPIWKFPAIVDTSSKKPLIIHPETLNETDSVYRFNRILRFLDEAFSSINHDLYLDVLQSSWRNRIDFLISNRGIQRYRELKYCAHNNVMTKERFKRDFNILIKENRHVLVKSNKGVCFLIPG